MFAKGAVVSAAVGRALNKTAPDRWGQYDDNFIGVTQ